MTEERIRIPHPRRGHKTIEVNALSKVPNCAALYALRGGQGRNAYTAYIGVAEALRRRLEQHLVRRDTSVTTGTSAVSLNPEYISHVHWWDAADFRTKVQREAAELVAFESMKPVLSSRGPVGKRANELSKEGAFRRGVAEVFAKGPAGILKLMTLEDAINRIVLLEEEVAHLRGQLEHRL